MTLTREPLGNDAPPRLAIIDRDNSHADLRGVSSGGPAWVVEQGRVRPDKQDSFDRFLDSCDVRASEEFRLISVRLVARCPAG